MVDQEKIKKEKRLFGCFEKSMCHLGKIHASGKSFVLQRSIIS